MWCHLRFIWSFYLSVVTTWCCVTSWIYFVFTHRDDQIKLTVSYPAKRNLCSQNDDLLNISWCLKCINNLQRSVTQCNQFVSMSLIYYPFFWEEKEHEHGNDVKSKCSDSLKTTYMLYSMQNSSVWSFNLDITGKRIHMSPLFCS